MAGADLTSAVTMLLQRRQRRPALRLGRLTGDLRTALETVIADSAGSRVPMERPTLKEAVAVTVICLATVGVAFAMSDRFPIWIDEVMGIDPGASLLLTDRFTSTAWPFQMRGEYWAGNSPLYYALLADWMRLAGFGIVEARSLNYLLAAIAGVLFWWGCGRLGILRRPTTRLLLIVTFLIGHGVTLNIWSARHDCLTMVLAALLLLNLTIPAQSARTIGFVVLAAALPMAGIHLLFYIGLLTAIGLLAFRRDAVPAASALAAGVALGGAFLYLMFRTNGVWFEFLVSTLGAQHSLTGQLAQVVLQGDLKGVARLVAFPLAFFEDHSFAVILAAAAIAWVLTPRAAPPRLRASAQLAILSGTLIPLALFFAGKFPIYYGWMALAPTAMFVFAWGEEYFAATPSAAWRWPVVVTATAGVLGLPTYVVSSLALPDGQRNSAIDRTARGELQANDWVYADYSSYVSARRVANVVMVPSYGNSFRVPGLPEREHVTVLFVSPRNLEAAIDRVGGEWTVSAPVGQSSAADDTPRVYRRRSASAHILTNMH